jgi:hypothetical protein
MDQHRLRSLVFDKTGIRIDVDDPVFALVALNEALLGEAVTRHVALLEATTGALAEQAQTLLEAGGGGGTARFGADHGGERPALLKPAPTSGAPGPSRAEQRLMAIAGAAAVLAALLVLFGQAILFKPVAPAPVSALSAEQQAAIEHDKKLSAIVDKLDSKTRNAIQAQMQKP